MMKKDKPRVPGSSLSEVKKIIMGYAHQDDAVDLEKIAKLTKVSTTSVSRNNGFLMQIGIIEGGKTKKCTEIGKAIGRALEVNLPNEVKKNWQKIIETSEFLSNLVSTVRMQQNNRMSVDDFLAHVLYAAGVVKNQFTMTGAKTILDILLEAELLNEIDGQLEVAKPATEEVEQPTIEVEDTGGREHVDQSSKKPLISGPTININIQLELPETEKPEVYENLFKALRKYLMDSDAE
ncbi:MAG: hypothetical protein WBB67_04300 [bacterium]